MARDRLLRRFAEIEIELTSDCALTDIGKDRFDARIWLGEGNGKDIIARRIGPDLRMVVFGTSAHFERLAKSAHPRELTDHHGISLQLAARCDLSAWEIEQGEQARNVRAAGAIIVNDAEIALSAARASHSLACTVETGAVRADVAAGRLVRVLADRCSPFSGIHPYHPQRHIHSPAFRAVLGELLPTAV